MNKKKLMALLLTGVMAASTVSVPVFAEEAEGGSSDTPLVIGQTNFSEKFSGLFHEAVPDQQIAENVGEYLFGSDRTGAIIYNGIEGETHEYNGTDYTYTGLSDVTVTEGEDETVYNFKLREGVTFSDGEPLTADDLIFTYYVLSDTDYDGNATFYSTNIKGMKNYRLNSTAADSITDEDVANTLADMPDEVAARVKDELIVPLLTSEYEWAQTAWEDYADAYGVTNGDEFFGMLYAADENYSVDGKDQDTIINEIADQYGKDYLALAAAYGDEAYFDEDAATIASEYLVEQKTAAGEGEEVANIEGIKKLGDYEVEVTTDGFEATTIYQLGVIVEPMHYYGDASLYDYDNNQFGFTRGDLSAVRDKSNQPLGAGPYKFVKYENKTVYMEANENYYKGAPKTKYLQWRETSDADKIAGVEQGTIDLSDPSGSKSAFDQIKSINGNDELNGDKIIVNATDNLGYGYIGLNANTINVGGEPGSDASKNLRKALTTVLAVYRDVAIDSYYGDAASVINYPISNTSWAAPQKSDADYQVAYSVDVDGNPLYTDDMTDDEKFAAATQAALGFFEAAGYTVENGKVTAAVLAVYRDVAIDSYYGDAASVINYPISNTSWAAPQKSDADYQVAYSVDVDGNPLYTDDMTDDEKFAAATQAALGFFEAAGYTVENGKVTAAPEGAKMTYEIIIGADGSGDHPSFAILTDAKAALESIGFTLEINDVTDSNIMWDALNAGTAEMWAAAWQATVDPDMYQVYHSASVKSNYYHINDETLDQDIIDARSTADQEYRKSVYKQCLDIILDWAVEIPIYQRQNCVIYSPERINADTFTKDVTTFYPWYGDIINIEMN